VDVDDGTTVAVVQTQSPVVMVIPFNEVKTEVVDQKVRTGVTRVGGSVVTDVVVITPTPGAVVTAIGAGQLVTQTVVNNVGGTPVTRVFVTTPVGSPPQPISYTVVRDSGGTLITEVIVTTPTGAPGQPVTLTAVDIVGGTPVTQVVVNTANGAVFQPATYTITTNVGGTRTVITATPSPMTIVETINGTPVTRFTTPLVGAFTFTTGGTLTTQTLVTTPTGPELITLTFTYTSGGTLSTFMTTIPATTRLTTLSGTPKTTTSTPSPTTRLSTIPPKTHTYTTTSTPTPTTPPLPDGPQIVPTTTRTYTWTPLTLFVGTFLPPLLAIALLIPLRIIDLQAKLYQPFHALSGPGGGGLGRDTLLLRYTGVWAFATPVVSLVRSGAAGEGWVPFLTTVMVGAGSLMVPLATEAVGMKLHGVCWVNTASAGCGPALGVSKGVAYGLVGVMVAVVGVLGVVGWLVGRWVTGVGASPWCLAGVAALAGCEDVRVREEGEVAMRRAVEGKRYGLGWWRNGEGREGYGIVLLDDEGRGLRREDGLAGDGDSGGSDGYPAAARKWGAASRQLPFMTLRYPWRIAFMLFQLGLLIFVIYYHAYYRGGIRDNGRLWLFLNSNTFGVRFVCAIIGVIIAFCWQSFFISRSRPFSLSYSLC
jgi:hypothetical protein